MSVRTLLSDLIRPSRFVAADGRDALAHVGLAHLADHRPSDLSLGQQKLVGVARAIAADPVAVILDESAAGLNDVLDFGRIIAHDTPDAIVRSSAVTSAYLGDLFVHRAKAVE